VLETSFVETHFAQKEEMVEKRETKEQEHLHLQHLEQKEEKDKDWAVGRMSEGVVQEKQGASLTKWK
jgi:hypothetical protein